MQFLLELPVLGGVQRDAGLGALAVPVLVPGEDLRPDGGLSCLAGGLGDLVQGQQRVDGLLRPGPGPGPWSR